MTNHRLAAFLVLLLAGCANLDQAAGRGLGVVLKPDALTYFGSAAFCTRPATIDPTAVRRATAEWREMQRDGVAEGSARHQLLSTKMHRRIVAACKRAASASGNDLVVRAGDIKDSAGVDVDDLTAAVVSGL